MQHNIFVTAVLSSFLMACQSHPSKAPPPQTMASLVEVAMDEKLDDLQNVVYALEDKIYGTRNLSVLGLYGELKSCRRKLASPQFGGPGNMLWSEPFDRLTDKEAEFKIGDDEKKDSVAPVRRFQNYRMILQKRSDEYSRKIEACKAELATREMDPDQPNRVMVSDAHKISLERSEINKYICSMVESGASLQAFMLNAFAEGWLALADYQIRSNLIAVSLKDARGKVKDHAFLFNGWKLAFDRQQATLGELFNGVNDARLVAWAFDRKADIPDSSTCLMSADGQWNPP